MIFEDPGQLAATAIALQLNFAPAIPTFDAFKHSFTRSAELVISRRFLANHYIALILQSKHRAQQITLPAIIF